MIDDTIETINILNKSGFDNKEAIGILVIEELKNLRGTLNEFTNNK